MSLQAWSITYHSWLTFVLLLWACLIWITPFARWFCMVSSPGLVIYAELLLLVQYVYGLQLTDDELPLQDSTGTFDYSELGLKKWQFPCLHLGAQVRHAISRMFCFPLHNFPETFQKILFCVADTV